MTDSPTIHDPVELIVRRIRAGLNQDGLAAKTGLSQSYISLLERGLRDPTGKTLRILADALRCEIDDLLRARPRRRRRASPRKGTGTGKYRDSPAEAA